jgi:HEAT repeat protein
LHPGRGKPEATHALLHVVKSDSALQVRITAAETLGELDGAETVTTLIELAKDENRDLARAALGALGRINHPRALASLLTSLRSPDSVRRCDATRALGRCGSVEAIDGLRWAATDADLNVSRCAIDSLASIPAREAIDAILTLSTDAKRREICIRALAHFGEDHIDWIGQRIEDSDPKVRSTVVAALARMKHPRATERMIEALKDPEPSIRLEAITALAHLGSRQGEAELAKLARSDPDMSVRQAARAAINNARQFGVE